jgi:hypothetical protein
MVTRCSTCTDSKKKKKLGKQRVVVFIAPLLHLHFTPCFLMLTKANASPVSAHISILRLFMYKLVVIAASFLPSLPTMPPLQSNNM